MIILDLTLFGTNSVLYTQCGFYGVRPAVVQHFGDAT